MVPGGVAIANEFNQFERDLPIIAANKRLETSELTFKRTDLQGFGRDRGEMGRAGRGRVTIRVAAGVARADMR